jgi:hypothetical protein
MLLFMHHVASKVFKHVLLLPLLLPYQVVLMQHWLIGQQHAVATHLVQQVHPCSMHRIMMRQ